MKLKLLAPVLALLLSACGFHLRGLVDIPQWLNNVAVIADNGNKGLAAKLKILLDQYQIDVNPDPDNAKFWLVINNSSLRQQIISIGASTNPRQYQLILTTEFSLQTTKGKIIKPPTKIMVSRQLTVNNDRILGSNDEENTLVNEMRQDTAVQILNRLAHQ